MSDIEDLAELIGDTWDAMPSPADHVWHTLADKILAAGWRPSARKIETEEELEALPPVIPDACNAVWASTRDDESRRVWVRTTGFREDIDEWDDGKCYADYEQGADLINPVPIPKEAS